MTEGTRKRLRSPRSRKLPIGLLVLTVSWLCLALIACAGTPTSVGLKLVRHPQTPRTASVIIDEQYIGPLYFVAARGVRLPAGPHRITVTKTGYFPWDTLIIAADEPIKLDVQLVKIPD